jgi:hypothetical protein
LDLGRKLLAGLELTTQAGGRTAEAMGEDLGRREQAEIPHAMQWDLPTIVGQPVPVFQVPVEGTAVSVVKKETVGRPG